MAELIGRIRAAIRDSGRATKVALALLAARYVAALLAPWLAPYSPSQQLDIVALKNQAPTLAHPFGTDQYSRDLLTRVLFGGRVSLSIATLAVLVSALVGTAYGLVAGAVGGVVDVILMRLLDAFLAIPRVLLLVAVLALWNPVPLGALVLLLGLTGWFEVSRLVRAEVLTLRERDFVTAGRALGATGPRLTLRHLLPNVLTPVVVATTVAIGNVITLEASLSFIGVGAREPVPSWGTLFYDGSAIFIGTWWGALFPGMAIVVTVLCFNVVGDALRRFLDPRHLRSA